MKLWVPTGVISRPEPIMRSFTVLEARIWPFDARSIIRAPMWTAKPPKSDPRRSHSPVWTPTRISKFNCAKSERIAWAHWIARVGPVKAVMKPSPVVLMVCPPKAETRR